MVNAFKFSRMSHNKFCTKHVQSNVGHGAEVSVSEASSPFRCFLHELRARRVVSEC